MNNIQKPILATLNTRDHCFHRHTALSDQLSCVLICIFQLQLRLRRGEECIQVTTVQTLVRACAKALPGNLVHKSLMTDQTSLQTAR